MWVIPDLHCPPMAVLGELSRLISSTTEMVIFLGDFFDRPDQTDDDIYEIARWLVNNGGLSNCRFLWGNHDIVYAYPHVIPRDIGFSERTRDILLSCVPDEVWRRFEFFHIHNGWLLSHAGLSKSSCPPTESMEELLAWLESEREAADACLSSLRQHWFWLPRDDSGKVGLLRCRVAADFFEVPSINQIFGHSYSNDAVVLRDRSENWCIDTANDGAPPRFLGRLSSHGFQLVKWENWPAYARL